MKYIKKAFLLVFALVFLFQAALRPANVFADAGPVKLYGVNIVPYNETNVALVKENLEIKMDGHSEDERSTNFSVSARFYLKNEGDATTVKTGFPFGLGRKYPNGTLMQAHDVKVKVNEKEIALKYIETEKSIYDPWIYFDLSFAKGEEKVLDVSYTASCPEGEFVYILKTGGYWKGGKIGTFDMQVEFPYPPVPPFVTGVSPEGYQIEKNTLVWHETDFAPDKDVEITFINPDFYGSIFSAKEKAEKTNSPEDWFEYALALMSGGNPFGPYIKNYLSDTAAKNFENYVETVFQKAISLQPPNSWRSNVLLALEEAHFSGDSFMSGFGFFGSSSSSCRSPSDAYFYLKNDINAPKSAEEGKILAAFSEYMFLSDFAEGAAFNSVRDFKTFVSLAEKYAPDDPNLFTVSDFGLGDFFIREGENMHAPLFVECFIPKVVTSKNYFELRYSLPPGVACAVANGSSLMDAKSMLKGAGVNCSFRQTLNGFAARFSFKAKNEEDFKAALDSAEKIISGYAFDKNGRIDSFGCALVNAYFGKIAGNLEFVEGKGITFKSKEADCTQELEKVSAELEKDTEFAKEKEGLLKSLNLSEVIYTPFLRYLKDSGEFVESAKENPKIEFLAESSGKQNRKSKTNIWEVLFFASLAPSILLLALVILLSARSKRAKEK